MDFSNVVYGAIFAQLKIHPNFDENFIRHVVLNCLLSYRKKYPNHGDMIICCDGGNLWRADIFPYYKAGRKEGRDASSIDFTELFRIMKVIMNELKEFMPYHVIQINKAESDDIIAVLANSFEERTVIISNDKDFYQLQKKKHVKQFCPLKQDNGSKGEVVDADPAQSLFEKIVRGDGGDGVPNIKSKGSSFMDKTRQKSIFSKELIEWSKTKTVPAEFQERFEENTKLIDLDYIPNDIHHQILDAYDSSTKNPRNKMVPYFMAKGLKLLMEEISSF